jgi:hypothetical protein
MVTIDDAAKAGYCARGVRRWFSLNPELDFRAFVRGPGIPASELLATDDALAIRTVTKALERSRG